MSYGLSFIDDDDLFGHVKNTADKYRFQIDLRKLNDNLIDPIKLTFDAGIYQKSFDNGALENVLKNEILRQLDKSNTNHIGYFHQNIFRYIGRQDGWTVPTRGFDVENPRQKIFVEMKNKHNTMNSSSSAKTYMRMQNKVLQDSENQCFLVEAIAKNQQNSAWVCRIDGETMKHEHIRRVSLDKFYEIVTGETTAFAQLCSVLPQVITDVVALQNQNFIQDSVIEDLYQTGTQDILKYLYLLAFKHYQGFDQFDWTR